MIYVWVATLKGDNRALFVAGMESLLLLSRHAPLGCAPLYEGTTEREKRKLLF